MAQRRLGVSASQTTKAGRSQEKNSQCSPFQGAMPYFLSLSSFSFAYGKGFNTQDIMNSVRSTISWPQAEFYILKMYEEKWKLIKIEKCNLSGNKSHLNSTWAHPR